MSKCISSTELSSSLTLSEYTDGFWLYDETRGMNISLQAKTPKIAFVEALTYYQNRLSQMESTYWNLKHRVDDFVMQFTENSEEE